MSHLPEQALTYEAVVAEYFLALRGAGLMLSPLDREQVRAWERRGLPVAVVCRGLRRGLEEARRDAGATVPRSLRRYRLAVEGEWRAYRGGRVGDAPPPPDEATASARRIAAADALLRAALARVAPGEPRHLAYRAALSVLRAGTPGEHLEATDRLTRAADAALLQAWLRAIPRAERTALGARCRLGAGERPAWTRRVEHRATLRIHLLEAAREAGLLCLRGSV